MAYSILLVDDEPLVLDGYRRQLNPYFNVDTATSGYDGLKKINNYKNYAAVVADFMMPGMDGVNFIIEARLIAPETIRLMLTGKGDLKVASEALNKGSIFMFLTKPCPSEQLLKAVIAAVEKYRGIERNINLEPTGVLEGLKLLHKGLVLWSQGKVRPSIDNFTESRAFFLKESESNLLARVNLLLAGSIILSSIPGPNQDSATSVKSLMKEAAGIYKPNGFPSLLRHEDELIIPAIRWAVDHNVEPEYFSKVLIDLGCPVPEEGLLRVRSLGSLQVENSKQQIDETDWRNPKVKLLFLYLLTNRHKKNDREVILETFWPEMKPQVASNNFSSCLYSLRQILGMEKVAYRKGFCWLAKEEAWFDADDFEEKVKFGRAKKNDGIEQEALSAYEEAVSLYHGDYLEEYAFEDWIVTEREHLKLLYARTLFEMADIYAGQSRYLEAAETLEKVPYSEVSDDQFLYNLTNYYILGGNRGKAIKRFKHYRSIMVSELGTEPAPAIAALIKKDN